MSRGFTISVKVLALVGFLLSAAITYLYANSVTVLYGALELIIAAVCYVGCIRRHKQIDAKIFLLTFIPVMLAWCAGLFGGNLKSTLLISVPLIMPLYISTWNITYKDWKDFVPVTIVAVAVAYLTIEQMIFGAVNSNTLGFLGFMGVSLGILWIKCTKKKLFPTAIVLIGFLLAANSGSRNVVIVGVVCMVFIFLPKGLLRKPSLYFAACLIVIGYSVFAEDIMAWAFSKPKLYEILTELTNRYSEKAWEMAGRVDFLRRVQDMIARRNFLQKLFGTGTLTTHGHNMFYQCVLNFGYVGTTLIYAMFCRLFKLAFVLIKKRQDDVALSCTIILWGTFLLQGADVFVIGPETYAVVPQVLMGVILHRYGVYHKECIAESRLEKSGEEKQAE